MKMQGTNVDFDARNLAEGVMYYLRGSNLSEDKDKVVRLKCPSYVAHQMKDYELTHLATTGFYFPPNFRSLVKETGDKIDGKFFMSKPWSQFLKPLFPSSAPMELVKDALQNPYLFTGRNESLSHVPPTNSCCYCFLHWLHTNLNGSPEPGEWPVSVVQGVGSKSDSIIPPHHVQIVAETSFPKRMFRFKPKGQK